MLCGRLYVGYLKIIYDMWQGICGYLEGFIIHVACYMWVFGSPRCLFRRVTLVVLQATQSTAWRAWGWEGHWP